MNRLRKFGPWVVAAVVIMACAVLPTAAAPTVGVSTMVAGTLQAMTPAAPAGLSVAYNNVSLVVPPGLATGTTNGTTADVEFPYVNPSGGPMPQHTKIILTGYPLQGTLFEPQITVFRSAEYAQYGALTQDTVSALQALRYAAGQPLPKGFPSGVLDAQIQAVDFASGHGLRYLTQFDEAPLPVNNHELFYYFQGLTTDGSQYVQVILPVQAAFLAADDNPSSALPPGGVPFDMNDLKTYFGAVAAKLNATAPDQFTPSLPALDALVHSIAAK